MVCRRCHPFFYFLISPLLLIFVSFLAVSIPAVGYAEVTLDGSLGPAKNLNGPNFVIDAGDGTLVNQTNLFHSFGTFNLSSNESATFIGPDSIHTIIGRITGGSQSSIDGLLRSAIPGADLFLLNPAGFLFGPHASLDVQGSFHVSTADYLRLGESGILYADPIQSSVLTVDPPTAFGFMGDNPAGISIQESGLEVPVGKTISLVGGNITIVGTEVAGTGVMAAPGGRINLAGVSSPGEVVLNAPGTAPDLEVDSFAALGDINFALAAVDAGGKGGGTVVIRGGCLALDDSSIHASSQGSVGPEGPGAGINIQAADNVVLDNGSYIGTNVFQGVTDDSAGVRIIVDQLEVKNNSEIQSVAFGALEDNPASSGNGGDITLTTNSLLLDNFGGIYTGTGGLGEGGDIFINTGSLEIKDGGYIYTDVFGGSGNGGSVTVSADRILMSNENHLGDPTGILTQTYWPGTGQGGDVTVNSKSLKLFPGSEISAATFYVGRSGHLNVSVEGDAYIEGTRELNPYGYPIYTGIFDNTFWSGDGGNLEFCADNLEITTAAAIQVSTYSTGNAGAASLKVGSLRIEDAAYIASNGYFGTGGDAGRVDVVADKIFISGPESSNSPFLADFTGISTSSGTQGGTGGDINVMTESLLMTNRGCIFSTASGPDQGGNINIEADTVEILNGAVINGGAYGSGDGGKINIEADSVLISGVYPEIYVSRDTGEETLSPSAITSQAMQNGGSGGTVKIRADSLELLDGGRLSTDTYGAGNAGDIAVVAGRVLIAGINDDLKDFFISGGGEPKYAASGIFASTSASLLGPLATGNGGHITIDAESLEMKNGGLITTETRTSGKGGDIAVAALNINMLSDAFISAESFREGDAGDIYLGAANSFLMRSSAVTTAARQADGGNIKVDTGYLVHLVDSEITASVNGGADTVGGNISIDPEYVVLDNSRIIANAYEGSGGNIGVIADVFLADPQSVLDASSALGVDGSVDIRAPITSVSGTIAPLPEEFRSVVALLRKPCMARIQQGKYSSFVVSGRDGLPRDPGTMLPSPLLSQ